MNPNDPMGMTINLITAILSLIAVIVSVVSIVVSFRQNKASQKISLEATFFQDIFNDYLREKIPQALDQISLEDQVVKNTNNLADVMCELRRDARYFYFSDLGFYEKLKKSLQEIEDECVNACNYSCTESMYANLQKKINEELASLYRLITKRYYGKS